MRNESGLTPVGYFVLIEQDAVEEKTAGGIYLPTQKQDADKLQAQEGVLVAVSPMAFTHVDWPDGVTPPQVGQRVLFKRFNGHTHEIGGRTWRLLNDMDIIAVVEPAAAEERKAA